MIYLGWKAFSNPAGLVQTCTSRGKLVESNLSALFAKNTPLCTMLLYARSDTGWSFYDLVHCMYHIIVRTPKNLIPCTSTLAYLQ